MGLVGRVYVCAQTCHLLCGSCRQDLRVYVLRGGLTDLLCGPLRQVLLSLFVCMCVLPWFMYCFVDLCICDVLGNLFCCILLYPPIGGY